MYKDIAIKSLSKNKMWITIHIVICEIHHMQILQSMQPILCQCLESAQHWGHVANLDGMDSIIIIILLLLLLHTKHASKEEWVECVTVR